MGRRSEASGEKLLSEDSDGTDVELARTNDGWTVIAQLPDVTSEELTVELRDGELCIGVRSDAEVHARPGMPGTGPPHHGFVQRVSVPEEVDPERMSAVFDDGVLTVKLPESGRPGVPEPIVTPGVLPEPVVRPDLPDPAADRELHHPDTVHSTPVRRFEPPLEGVHDLPGAR